MKYNVVEFFLLFPCLTYTGGRGARVMRGRTKAQPILNGSEGEQLQPWTRRRKVVQALALRARGSGATVRLGATGQPDRRAKN